MKTLTVIVSFALALAWLWGAYQAVTTPIDEMIYAVSVVIFAVLWFAAIWLKRSGVQHGDRWLKGMGYFFFAVLIAYLILQAFHLEPYVYQVGIVSLVSWFGIFIVAGYRLIENKVVT